MKPASNETRRSHTGQLGFAIVGIGASAGGLEAFTLLLKHLPVDTGMAFVLIQHLDPSHVSALPLLLSRATRMAVREIGGSTKVEPNVVYVIPPGRDIAFSGGKLSLRPRPNSRAPHLSIDYFFESLAQEQHERAIGVVLSGTATDGTLGLEAIKAEGGITFAQDGSAKYDAMPRNAISAGCVDFVLSPGRIAAELARIAKHPYVGAKQASAASPAVKAKGGRGRATALEESALPKILQLLQSHGGADFTSYKPSTIERRIARRMVLGKIESQNAYIRLLKDTPAELEALFRDLLIGVTSFFRNPEAFDGLRKRAFPKLFKGRNDEPIRVWTLGCSTGQEAYSIAMALLEYADSSKAGITPIQIYATDLNDAALAKARQGLYPKNLVADLSPARLARFFVEEHGGYRVSKLLREMCVFARHNFLSDPPFSRMDLITCRNVLIYLEPETQKQVFPSFHYALKRDGFLFLGASESIGSFTDLFQSVDKKHKLYARKSIETPARRLQGFSVRQEPKAAAKLVPIALRGGLPPEISAQREADRITLKQYAPPAVMINAAFQVLQFRGTTGSYLEPSSGKANFHVLQMAREGLMLPLRAAINEARKHNRKVRRAGIGIRQGSRTRRITIEVTPLLNVPERYFLISFEEAEDRWKAHDSESGDAGREASNRLTPHQEKRRSEELERELSETRDYLQSLQQQHETANEEIQASHEEGQSANEELQSINEELETSKEELESSNEELITVNDEMVNRNAELNRLNADLNNLHLSINTPILVLGRDLAIRRFTPAAQKVFNLLTTDLGRLIGGVRSSLNYPGLEVLVADVIRAGTMRECEVQDHRGHWYLLRVRPYVTAEDEIDGAVVVLIDINALKSAEHDLGQARDYSDAILRTAHDALLVLRPDLRVSTANDAFYRLFQTSAKRIEGKLIFRVGTAWNVPELRALLVGVLADAKDFDDFELAMNVPDLGQRTFVLSGRRMVADNPDDPKQLILSMVDITERLEARAALRDSEVRYRRLFEAAQDGVLLVDPKTRKIVDANPFIVGLLGYEREEFIGKELFEIGLLGDEAASQEAFRELRKKRYLRYDNLPLRTKKGTRCDVEFVSNLYTENGVDIAQCNIRDITVRLEAEEALRQNDALISVLIAQSPVGTYLVDDELTIQQANSAAEKAFGPHNPPIGRALVDVVRGAWPEEVTENVLNRFRHTLRTGEPFTAREFAAERADSKTHEVYDWQLQRVTRPDGRHGVVCYFSDITERRRNELRVAMQSRSADLLAQVAAQLLLTSAPGASLGAIFQQLAGVLQVEMFLSYVVSRDGRKLLLEHSGGLLAAQRAAFAELDINRGLDGSFTNYRQQTEIGDIDRDELPEHATLRSLGVRAFLSQPLRAGSQLLGVLVLMSVSRSQFERQEMRFIQTIGDLGAASVERAKLLSDTAKARDVAEAANQAKDDFLAAVSHELRTPLNPVLLLASDRAHDEVLPPDVRKDFETIAKNVTIEARLIDDLLDLARVAHAKLAVQRHVVDVHAILSDALANVRPEVDEKLIKVSVELGATHFAVVGDALRLQQVFWNVLRNAVKFTPKGGKVSVATADAGPSHIEITISDTGIGMTAGELGRMFERFTQGEHARPGSPTQFGGLGLGLSISRMLVESHSGKITASSAGRDKGTSFRIELPVVRGLDAVIAIEAAAAPEISKTEPPLLRRLLLVEDHEPTRTALARLLVRRGYAVVTAGTVAESRVIAAEHVFDVLVCDIGLPDGSGLDLMKELKKVSPILAIAMTGFGAESDIENSKRAGFGCHLTKPVSIQALTQALAALQPAN